MKQTPVDGQVSGELYIDYTPAAAICTINSLLNSSTITIVMVWPASQNKIENLDSLARCKTALVFMLVCMNGQVDKF